MEGGKEEREGKWEEEGEVKGGLPPVLRGDHRPCMYCG